MGRVNSPRTVGREREEDLAESTEQVKKKEISRDNGGLLEGDGTKVKNKSCATKDGKQLHSTTRKDPLSENRRKNGATLHLHNEKRKKTAQRIGGRDERRGDHGG